MLIVILLLISLIIICLKNKLYYFSILPISLLIKYLFLYLVKNTDFFEIPFLYTILDTCNINFIERSDIFIDSNLVDRITIQITFFYLQIIIFSHFLSRIKLIKKISLDIINNINESFIKIYFNKDNILKFKNQGTKLSIFEIFLLLIITLHAISFYSSDYLFFHEKYLFINSSEYYYFYPKLSLILVKAIFTVFPLFFITRIFKSGTKFFNNFINILVFIHTLTYYLAINSRYIFVYTFGFTIYFSYSIYINNKDKILNRIKAFFIFFTGSYISILAFSKILFFRNKLSGIGTIFYINQVEFEIVNAFKTIIISFFNSLFIVYSGIDQNIQTSFIYDVFSLLPIPSYLFSSGADALKGAVRISNYCPSPTYVQIYQNNYFYQFIIVILISFVLAITINQNRILNKLKKSEYKILKFYPIAYEAFISFILFVGFQYYSRTIMTYYWYTFFVFIIVPLLLGYYLKRKKNII